MNRWARIQTGIAGAGTLAFAAAGAHGWATRFDAAGLPLHAQVSLLATLALVLSHTWIALFALACRRRLAAAPGLRAAESRMIAAAVLALGAAVAHFAIAGRLFAAHTTGRIHLVSAITTLAILAAALVVEARALGRHQREASALGDDAAGAPRVLDSASP
jgi:hypothetical protein